MLNVTYYTINIACRRCIYFVYKIRFIIILRDAAFVITMHLRSPQFINADYFKLHYGFMEFLRTIFINTHLDFVRNLKDVR